MTACSRSPYGERGLKSSQASRSRPYLRRSPYGERGLKSAYWAKVTWFIRRSPYGERGLKYKAYAFILQNRESLPIRGAWIEMQISTA